MAAKTKKKGKKRRRRAGQLVCRADYNLGKHSPKTGKKFKGGPMCVSKTGARVVFPKVIREKKRTKRGLGQRGLGPTGRSPIIPQRVMSVRGLKGGCGCGA